MEFSILIPVYNTSVQQLVKDLYLQAQELTTTFQILLIDDCSNLSCSYLNKKLSLLDNVTYQILIENIGRASIRNLLFETAKYEKCIVLDGDMSIIKTDFIKIYLESLSKSNIVVGGHVYQKIAPSDKKKYLHWLYGTKIESQTAKKRAKNPYDSFMSSNFACSKTTFNQLKFDEQIKGYGHEDTLFGFQAKNKNILILHIENPVQHDGIDSLEVFLSKQQNAIKNLKKLVKHKTYGKQIKQGSKLVKLANIPTLGFWIKLFKNTIKSKIQSEKANLWVLQLQKLLWLIS